jgi:hypothetical protein
MPVIGFLIFQQLITCYLTIWITPTLPPPAPLGVAPPQDVSARRLMIVPVKYFTLIVLLRLSGSTIVFSTISSRWTETKSEIRTLPVSLPLPSRLSEGLANRLIDPGDEVGVVAGKIACQYRLGGILRHYHCNAAYSPVG